MGGGKLEGEMGGELLVLNEVEGLSIYLLAPHLGGWGVENLKGGWGGELLVLNEVEGLSIYLLAPHFGGWGVENLKGR